jgi:hypothetical protein
MTPPYPPWRRATWRQRFAIVAVNIIGTVIGIAFVGLGLLLAGKMIDSNDRYHEAQHYNRRALP